jgi:hypothetical protein
MIPSRRAFLVRSLAAGLGAAMAGGATAQILPLRDPPLAEALARHTPTLAALVDTYLPDDGVTPAASALGVDADLRDFLTGAPQVAQGVLAMCDALDAEGQVRFALRGGVQRLALVDAIARVTPDRLEGWFYRTTRLLALEFYYARPEALEGLDLDPAPQPAGYLPPWG